jgi:hypothetical protein
MRACPEICLIAVLPPWGRSPISTGAWQHVRLHGRSGAIAFAHAKPMPATADREPERAKQMEPTSSTNGCRAR